MASPCIIQCLKVSFADAVFAYEDMKEHTYHTHTNGWGIGLYPGILVDLTQNLQLLARTTLVQYTEAGKKSYKVKQIGFSVGNNLELGVQFHF